MSAPGLTETYRKVMNANGPAQMLPSAFWGVLMAGMFHGVCDMCITPTMLIVWASISALVVPVTVWGRREWLRNVLLADVAFSAWILAIFVLHEPHTTEFVYYSFSVDGGSNSRDMATHSMSDWFHITALVWMTLHALYLADLTNRQILEKRLFSNDV